MLAQRVLSAAVALPLLLAIIGLGPAWAFVALVLALIGWAQWELYRMFASAGVIADLKPGLLLGALVGLAFAFGGASRLWLVPGMLSLAVVSCLALGLRRPAGADRRPGRDWGGVALTLLGVCYCAWLLGHAIWLRALPDGPRLVLLGLWITWCGETAAYFVGRRWGRSKLAPRVSPAKTVEGAIAQLFASLAASLVAGFAVPLPARHLLGIGALLGIVGQLGDLAESSLKRSAGTKDAGTLLPGHGGLLDRLDSLLFNLPALYYYWMIFLAGRNATT